jgi:hypothetical protein
VVRSRRRGATCDEGEAGGSDKTYTVVLPRCQCIGEKRSSVTRVVVNDVYVVDSRDVCGEDEERSSPVSQISRRQLSDERV